jgi:MFS family permease
MATASEGSSEAVGVLRTLDGQKATKFYWYLTVLACVGGFLFGYDTSVVGSVLNFIPYQLSDLATGYLVAGASLGAAVGAISAGPLTDRFGRKSLLIVDALIYAVGALLSAVTVNAEMLIISRTLIGLAVGADSAIATAYIAEFAPAKKRGGLSIIQQWMITVGILVSYLIAMLIFAVAPHSLKTVDWRIVFGLGAVPAIIAMLLRARMPESPRWLLDRGRYADTQQAFDKLGIQVTEEEVRDTADQLREQAERQEKQRQWTPGVVRALIIVCIFFVFQQITGINVPSTTGPSCSAGCSRTPAMSSTRRWPDCRPRRFSAR